MLKKLTKFLKLKKPLVSEAATVLCHPEPGPSPAGASGAQPPRFKPVLPISSLTPRLLHTSNIVFHICGPLCDFWPPAAKSWRWACPEPNKVRVEPTTLVITTIEIQHPTRFTLKLLLHIQRYLWSNHNATLLSPFTNSRWPSTVASSHQYIGSRCFHNAA